MSTIKKSRLAILLAFSLVSLLITWSVTSGHRYDLSYLLLFILVIILFSYFYLQDEIDLFSPMTLFSIFYCTMVPASYYLISNNFDAQVYATHYSADVEYLFNVSLFYIIAGYLSALLGYLCIRKAFKVTIRYESIVEISDRGLRIVASVLFSAGVLNFALNVAWISGGDIVDHMRTISVRHALSVEIPHTTLFYLGTYASIYLMVFYLKRLGKSSLYLLLPLSIAMLMLFSTGRVFSTASYALSIMAVYYYVNKPSSRNRNNRYLILIGVAGLCAVVFYLYRTASSVALDRDSDINFFSIVENSSELFQLLVFIVFERAYVPNIPVLMKIIDSWDHDIGFLYGSSLVSWVFNVMPSFMRPEGYQPSMMIKDTGWFPDALGAHPPTGIGEMYANFGLLGPFLGMLLFGAFCAFIRNLLLRYNNFWYLAIYCQIVTGFIFLYPKGEFDNLSLWQVAPILFAYLLCRGLTRLLRFPGTGSLTPTAGRPAGIVGKPG